jgi:hypothetical protein
LPNLSHVPRELGIIRVEFNSYLSSMLQSGFFPFAAFLLLLIEALRVIGIVVTHRQMSAFCFRYSES